MKNTRGAEMENLAAARRALVPSFDGDKQSNASEKAETQLKMEIEEQWLKLNKLHAKLLEEETIGKVINPESTMLQVSEAKEKRLEAEIDVLKKTKPTLLSTNSEVIDAALLSSLQTSIQQLKQTLSVVKTQRRELVEETERERILLEQHCEVKASLEQKLESERKDPNKPTSSRLKMLEEKKKEGIKEQQRIMRNLGQFAMKHFPMPMPQIRRKPRKASEDDQDDEYIGLLHILEMLMNASTGAENHNPYIQITSEFWPPYVELLLRCGIAKRHPDDSNRICLTAFHL